MAATNTPSTPRLSKKAAMYELYRRGVLDWKLDDNQKTLKKLYEDSKEKINVWLLSRRSGKTHSLLILALEKCLSHPGSIVKFLGPTKLQVRTFVRPLMEKILQDCPKELKPQLKEADYIYYFINGSELHMAGADNGHAEKLRGSDAHLILIDEAGSIDGLKYIIQSVLLPTTLLTKGKILMASTPPVDQEHDFLLYIDDAEKNNTIIKKTIFDNPRLTEQDIKEAEEEMGGRTTESFRREYLCEIIKSGDTAVIPEFNEDLIKEIVREWPTPPYYDCYVAMDLGFKDLTAVIFGYYDFRAAKIIIQDEIVADFKNNNMNLASLTRLIDEKEAALWTNILTNERRIPLARVSDIDYIVMQEINKASFGTLSFGPAAKYDREAAINNLRTLLGTKRIIINPKCKNLIRHLKNARWSKSKTAFARSSENGHYDLVSACQYFCRAISFSKNPYPMHYELNLSPGNYHTLKAAVPRTETTIATLNSMFNMRGIPKVESRPTKSIFKRR